MYQQFYTLGIELEYPRTAELQAIIITLDRPSKFEADMSQELERIRLEGANAYRLRINRNPYSKYPADPSPEAAKEWDIKFRAWEFGWSREKRIKPHAEHKSTKGDSHHGNFSDPPGGNVACDPGNFQDDNLAENEKL